MRTGGQTNMSYTDQDVAMDAYYADLDRMFQEGLKDHSKEAVKSYLGKYGDAVDLRVASSVEEAKQLLESGNLGAAVVLAATAVEVMIRFLLLQPLVQGAFLSNEWAGILTERVVSSRSRSVEDRKLIPAVLRQWGLDVTMVKMRSSKQLWEFVVKQLFPIRNKFVHQYDALSTEFAKDAIECAEVFRSEIVGAVARVLGFTLDVTGKWCEIRHHEQRTALSVTSAWVENFESANPFQDSP
jgi:hypothetical protein